ncbi:chloroplastic group IIA intron splicing facilitator CRS1, chloroplastic isoform X1 [Gossypium australe]|uniref:Chloroplastic group IIA intron splicing facilitator CRS1, chloroplastic isoform X1 n=1 Tax=Gossypium australe TaxID=47621 RepID=A0A5B6UID0_9ROSI|nr:chloroplastic group IIA intron splicing facilitator CRS1, chloroplastic isoform X1 [Gossypium australe]
MLLSMNKHPPLTLLPTTLIQPPILSPQYLKPTLKPRKYIFLIRSSITRPENQALPQSAIQRIADKLRSLGFSETPNPQPESKSGSGCPGEIFVPLPEKLPKYRVGHTIDTSWSTPENPVPDPGSDPGSLMVRFRDMKRERKKMGRVKEDERVVPSLAELKLSAAELKRLRTVGIGEKRKLKVGKAGITEGIVNGIHERWRKSEVVRIVCEDICKMNMKRTHEVLERKTGGLVIWRSGSKIILYRGANYKYPYFSADKIGTHDSSSNASPDTNVDNKELDETESCSSEFNGVKTSTPKETDKMTARALIEGVGSPSRVRFQLPGEAELVAEADRLLDGLGPRFTDWWGYEPLPVDGDLLPAIIPGYRRPFRLLPYGVKSLLTNDEMTTLRRLGRPLPCHFALGRNRKLQGLAASIIKLWEKCEIAKIAVKRGVQNTNSELMAEELKWLTGGTLLSRDKDFIVLYRGKDFLPSAVSSAIEERRKHVIHAENQSGKPMQEVNGEGTKIASENDINSAKDRKSDVFSVRKNLNSAEATIKRTSSKLSMALEKKAKAKKLLAELEQEVIPQQSEIDKEGITREERYMLRKVGLRMKPFLLLGRRGVFDGTVENMHLHWKYRELVKIISKETNVEAVHQEAQILEAESGGILVAVERVSKGYAIIFYRGKNYERPTCLRPQTLLTKREAMKRSLEEQRRKSLKLHILKLTRNIDELKHQLVVDKEASGTLAADQSRLPSVEEDMETLQSVKCARSDIEYHASPEGHLEAKDKSESTSLKNDRMIAAVSISKPSEQVLVEPSTIHDGVENHKTESEFSSESVNRRKHNTELRALHSQFEMVDSSSHHDNLMEENAYSNGPMESMVESASKNLDVLISPAADNVSNKMASTAKFLSNKERLLLRKQALNMKKRPVLAVGRSNIVTGVAKTINTHFKKHPLAIVNVKGRAKGTSVQEVVLKLQEATGAVLVSQEPSKVILYRGWGANDEPACGDKRNVKDSPVQNQPAVSPELIAAIKFECGLQCHQEEEAP